MPRRLTFGLAFRDNKLNDKHMRVDELLRQYIWEERELIGKTEDNNYFGLVFSDVPKYYRYLTLIWPAYQELSDQYAKVRKAMQASFKAAGPGSHPMTPEQTKMMDESRSVQEKLHKEMESIYLFSNILLDRLAAATEYYFGNGAKPWGSFDSMRKYFKEYCEHRGVTAPKEIFSKRMEWLYKYVAQFRHELLVHKHEKDFHARILFGTGYNAEDNETLIALSLMYPREGEQPLMTVKPREIMENLDAFLEGWVEHLQANRNKRNLSPRP